MNKRIFELAKQADIIQWDILPSGARTPDHESVVKAKRFAELIVKECINTMLNTDEQKFVVETEGWDLGGANHGAWERGVLDAVSTVKEHFGVEE